jgi:hypothetical protein
LMIEYAIKFNQNKCGLVGKNHAISQDWGFCWISKMWTSRHPKLGLKWIDQQDLEGPGVSDVWLAYHLLW